MPPARKKAKTTYAEPLLPEEVHVTDPALHPDLAAQSSPLKMDPAVLHPDLAAASTVGQTGTFTLDGVAMTSPTPAQPKQRKNAAPGSKAAAAAAAKLNQQQQQQQQQQQPQEQEQQFQQPQTTEIKPESIPQPEPEPEESHVSIDAAAEFLRTIQERESQKNLLALTAQAEPVVGQDGSIPTDLSALQYPIHQTQSNYPGFPTAAQFNAMMDDYLGSLSVKKQAKALLTQQMYDDILTVLLHPTETKTGSAQFRFWAKKMFKLVSTQVAHIVIHENKPVAVKEQLYDVLVQCHGQANHGGRDKTAAQVYLFNFSCLMLINRFVNFILGFQRSSLRGLSRDVRAVCATRVLIDSGYVTIL